MVICVTDEVAKGSTAGVGADGVPGRFAESVIDPVDTESTDEKEVSAGESEERNA